MTNAICKGRFHANAHSGMLWAFYTQQPPPSDVSSVAGPSSAHCSAPMTNNKWNEVFYYADWH